MKTKIALIALVTLLVLPWSVLLLNRGQAAVLFVGLYELAIGYNAGIPAECPFTDAGGNDAILKMYGLGITAGTSATTYSPDAPLKLYQALLFAGKTLQRIEEYYATQ